MSKKKSDLDDKSNEPETTFDDKVKVYTAPSGTQYVDPIDLFLTDERLIRIRKEVEERRKKKTSTAVQT